MYIQKLALDYGIFFVCLHLDFEVCSNSRVQLILNQNVPSWPPCPQHFMFEADPSVIHPPQTCESSPGWGHGESECTGCKEIPQGLELSSVNAPSIGSLP